jgi:hypothetical protein
MAIEANFAAILAEHALQADGFIRRGQRIDGLIGIELAAPFAADHEVAILLLHQPGDIGGCGDPRIHDDQPALWCGQTVEHVHQRRGFGDIAGEQLRAAHEAAAIEHQTKGDQRTIGSFLLRPATGGFGVCLGGALEIGVGQIVERHGLRQGEQILDAAEECVLDPIAVFHQQIGAAVELHQRHRFEVHAEQFAQRAAFAQPAPGRAFACRCGHASDQAAGDGGALDRVEAEVREDRIDAQPVHGGEARGFHAHAARLDELQRGDVDLGEDRVWRGGFG